MRSKWPLLFLLMHIAGSSDAATAQTLDQQRCSALDLDLIISGCTAVIQSGRETPQNLATAFNNRGVAYASKRQLDRAIQDYDEAIRINPNFADGFYKRGRAYAHTRQYDRAIQDYDQAIRINPYEPNVLRARDLAKRAKGDHPRRRTPRVPSI
jgi:tetratricopeptide (TPR) repeat protein